jgi:hypothetical protein
MVMAIGGSGSTSGSDANKYQSEISALQKQLTNLQKQLAAAAKTPGEQGQILTASINEEIQAIQGQISQLTGMEASAGSRSVTSASQSNQTKGANGDPAQQKNAFVTAQSADSSDSTRKVSGATTDQKHHKTARHPGMPTLLGNEIDEQV